MFIGGMIWQEAKRSTYQHGRWSNDYKSAELSHAVYAILDGNSDFLLSPAAIKKPLICPWICWREDVHAVSIAYVYAS